MNIKSMQEWLASWGDGPNWSDPSGMCVPITKATLRQLLVDAERMRDALQELRTLVLLRAPGSTARFSPLDAASIATICDDALEGNE